VEFSDFLLHYGLVWGISVFSDWRCRWFFLSFLPFLVLLALFSSASGFLDNERVLASSLLFYFSCRKISLMKKRASFIDFLYFFL
jgi:hypothetical protein